MARWSPTSNPSVVHPDDVVALLSGQQVDSSARRQLTRLHGLTDRLVSADPSSSLSLILSALGAALGSDRLCIHLRAQNALICAASLGLPPMLQSAWSRLPYGPAGGPVGLAAAAGKPLVEENVRTGLAWAPFDGLARAAEVRSSWSVPVMGPGGHLGVITVFGQAPGSPQRDQLDLVNLYAGYAASAIERDRLLEEVTARNRVLETIREMLETLAGPIPVAEALGLAAAVPAPGPAGGRGGAAHPAGRPDALPRGQHRRGSGPPARCRCRLARPAGRRGLRPGWRAQRRRGT